MVSNNRCTAPACESLARSRTAAYCEMHYGRLRRLGSLELPPHPNLRHNAGYILVYAPEHPLTQRHSSPREYEHRIRFYDAHGEGPFTCEWCGCGVTWDTMHVDHVNATPDDNRVENLVASCPPCNQARGHERMRATIRCLLGHMLEHHGRRQTVSEWARELGISRAALQHRLKTWPLSRALTEPRGKTGPRRAA